jgi:hypothetical protein
MKNTLKRFEKWFDLNLAWLFINGNKQEKWCETLKEKYPEEYKKASK